MQQTNETKHFQEYMATIRKSIGWSADALANKIGTQRQTINNLESKPPRALLSNDRYIAIRTILSNEINKYPNETEILKSLLEVCVDRYDDFTDEQRGFVVEKAKIMIPTLATKEVDREVTNSMWTKVLPVVAAFAAGVVVGANYNSFGWLNKIGSNQIEKTISTAIKKNK